MANKYIEALEQIVADEISVRDAGHGDREIAQARIDALTEALDELRAL